MFKVNNKDTRTTPCCHHTETSQLICSANMMATWRRSGVFVNFEHT